MVYRITQYQFVLYPKTSALHVRFRYTMNDQVYHKLVYCLFQFWNLFLWSYVQRYLHYLKCCEEVVIVSSSFCFAIVDAISKTKVSFKSLHNLDFLKSICSWIKAACSKKNDTVWEWDQWYVTNKDLTIRKKPSKSCAFLNRAEVSR